jgi:hypothetical protein
MADDPYDLLFVRNVRLTLGNTPVNVEIGNTYRDAPKEFAFSNNGITILSEKVTHDPGSHEVRIENPRIVNGSQTLHSVRDVPNPSRLARVMVRIIEIPPLSATGLPTESAKRKDIIHKISIRSNRQNDIKKWDLVSNDDFQHELARHFRTKNFYYERRRKEWSQRRTELKSLGIKKGPELKQLTQLLASFYWNHKLLGPVAAKSELGKLFDGRPYDQIKETPPELAYQLFLLSSIIEKATTELARHKRYVANLAGHMRFALFAFVVKALQGAKVALNSQEFTKTLEAEIEGVTVEWYHFTEQAIRHIHVSYGADAKRYKKSQKQVLTLANYFKSNAYVSKIFQKPLPLKVSVLARGLCNFQ